MINNQWFPIKVPLLRRKNSSVAVRSIAQKWSHKDINQAALFLADPWRRWKLCGRAQCFGIFSWHVSRPWWALEVPKQWMKSHSKKLRLGSPIFKLIFSTHLRVVGWMILQFLGNSEAGSWVYSVYVGRSTGKSPCENMVIHLNGPWKLQLLYLKPWPEW